MFSKLESYERFMGRWSRRLAPELVAFAGVGEGDRVLDVGSGTGALSLALCEVAAHVTGVDPSADFVAGASERHAGPRVSFQVADARALPFADASFDRTLSLLVMNFIPEPALALDEMIRVTKPGGVIAAAVWDYAEGMQMLRLFWDEAVALDPALAPRDEARVALCKRGELAALWQTRLERVEQAALELVLRFDSFDDYWGPFLLGQGPAGAHATSLPDEQRAALEARLRRRLPDGPFELRARAWAAKGAR